ncbi:hypothetical protein [Algibacter sp. Ld11]|uniref:hypothetical protein n=1 Tax=Algibacter sp. Ld11 TaxID=649150 RepID=UPI00386CEFC8
MPNETTSHFPYKTLIWALFAALALFIFKPQIEMLLTDAEHIIVFGIEIKTNKEQANKLTDSIQQFEIQINSLSTQITTQQNQIKTLDRLRAKLENDLKKCPDVQENVKQYSLQLNQIFKANTELKTKSDVLKDVKILQRSNLLKQP